MGHQVLELQISAPYQVDRLLQVACLQSFAVGDLCVARGLQIEEELHSWCVKDRFGTVQIAVMCFQSFATRVKETRKG